MTSELHKQLWSAFREAERQREATARVAREAEAVAGLARQHAEALYELCIGAYSYKCKRLSNTHVGSHD